MPTAAAVRLQIETALAQKIPSALTPAPRLIRPVASTGIPALDQALHGGLPIGAVTEIAGPESSGRTALTLSFLARLTREQKVCAWIDATNSFDPESAAAAGLDLHRLLWIRCGAPSAHPKPVPATAFVLPPRYSVAPPATKGLHGGGFGPHPRTEVKGLADAVHTLLHSPRSTPPSSAPAQQHLSPASDSAPIARGPLAPRSSTRQLSRIEQALRVADLLLQGGGFASIVLDLAGLAPEIVSRVPAATWFRYRASAEKTQAAILLLTQHACAQSSAGLVLRMQAAEPRSDEPTLFTGFNHRIEIARQRFAPTASAPVLPLRKPPQSERPGAWTSRPVWVGRQ